MTRMATSLVRKCRIADRGDEAYSTHSTDEPAILLLPLPVAASGAPSSLAKSWMGKSATPRGEGSFSWPFRLAKSRISSMQLAGSGILRQCYFDIVLDTDRLLCCVQVNHLWSSVL